MYFKYCFYLILLGIFTNGVFAQDSLSKNLDYYKIFEKENIWLKSNNPAGLFFNRAKSTALAKLGYAYDKGDYYQYNQAQNNSKISIVSKGYTNLNKIKLFGSFEFNSINNNEQAWNSLFNSQLNTPFVLADSVIGDFDKESYKLGCGISFPLSPKFILGVNADLKAGVSAKQKDPRPESKYLNINTGLGLIYNTKNNKFGLNFKYTFNKEELDYKVLKDKNNIYSMLGLGFYKFLGDLNKYYRKYSYQSYGIEAQYNYVLNEGKSILVNAFFLKGKQEIVDGLQVTEDIGYYNCTKMGGDIEYLFANEEQIQSISLKLETGEMKSFVHDTRTVYYVDEPDKKNHVVGYYNKIEATNQRYKSTITSAQLAYNLMKLKSKDCINSNLKALCRFQTTKNSYNYPPSYTQDFQDLIIGLEYDQKFKLFKNDFALGTVLGYKHNLSSKNALQEFDEVKLTKELAAQEFNYKSTSNYKVGGHLAWYPNIIKNKKEYNFMVKASYIVCKPTEDKYFSGSRKYTNLSLVYSF